MEFPTSYPIFDKFLNTAWELMNNAATEQNVTQLAVNDPVLLKRVDKIFTPRDTVYYMRAHGKGSLTYHISRPQMQAVLAFFDEKDGEKNGIVDLQGVTHYIETENGDQFNQQFRDSLMAFTKAYIIPNRATKDAFEDLWAIANGEKPELPGEDHVFPPTRKNMTSPSFTK